MLFSVIIPTYNRASLLREALGSVFAQTFQDFEVIVVDDGSTDGTWEELQALGSPVRARRQQNAGPGAARNLGAAQARGDYLAFLDSDDLWFPWTLGSYAECVRRFPTASFLGGIGTFFGPGEPLTKPAGPLICRFAECFFASVDDGEFSLPTPAVALRRTSFLELGGFAGQHVGEDMDFWLRAGCLAGFARIDSPPMCAERRHAARTTRSLDRTLSGLNYIMQAEGSGRYPGGTRFKRVRAARIARAARSVSVACLNAGRYSNAWQLYCKTCGMNVRLRRWKYLLGFLPALATARVRSFAGARPLP